MDFILSVTDYILNSTDYILNITENILGGVTITIKLYFVTLIFSPIFGILAALAKSSKIKLLKKTIGLYTWVFRGTPLLLQLFFAYYGLPALGVTLTAFQAASITFIINYTAYLTEIFRGGIESIEKGQYEAAKVLGLNYRQTMTRIVIPQTIKRVLPPLSNEAITLVKDTALVAVIGMGDVLRVARQIFIRDFRVESFIVAAIFYLIFSSGVVKISEKLEKKYSYID